MKQFALLAVLFTVPAIAATTTYKLDPKGSTVAWSAKKVTGSHNGTLALKEGKLEFDGDALKGGEFSVDMKALKVLDLTDPKYNGDLTEHLKSDDFFAVAKAPEAKFTAKKVAKKADGTWDVTGPMVIKGISQEVTVPMTITKKGDVVEGKGKAVLDRTKWDIKFRSGKFFPGLGDKMIYDNFDVEVTFTGKKA
jgi:polyisoprenoid-binding protein YceI